MIINQVVFPDPESFKISPQTVTSSRRTLSGKVWATRTEKRDLLEITMSQTGSDKTDALALYLYGLTIVKEISVKFDRAAPYGLTHTGGFKGKVEYRDSTATIGRSQALEQAMTYTFYINTREVVT